MDGTPFRTPRSSLPAIVGLLRRLPRNHAALALLAAIVLVTSFSLAALPGYVTRMSDDGLRRSVTDARPFERNLSLTQVSALPLGPTGAPTAQPRNLADVEATGAALQGAMPSLVQNALVRREVVADAPRWRVQAIPGAPPVFSQRFLQLRIQSGIDSRTKLVAGRYPASRPAATLAQLTGNPAAGGDLLPVYEMAISQATAEALEIRNGDRLLAAADPVYLRDSGLRLPPANYRVIVEVVGLIDLADGTNQTDDYWLDDPRLMQPGVFETPDVTMIYATGLLAPDAFQPLLRLTSPEPWTYQWRYFTDPARLNQDQLADFESSVRRLGLSYPPTIRARTGLADLARRFADQRLFAISILALAAAGVAATALAVLGVLAGLLAERRRAGIALIRSRGASPAQIAATQAIEGLIVTLPAALIGGGAALAWLRPPSLLPALLAMLATALAATATLIAATLPLTRQNLGSSARRQATVRSAALPRLVLEGLVLILTATGVVLLRRRGLAETGQLVDPYLVAVPILLGLAAGIIALRLLPLLVRALGRPATRGRGLIPLLAVRRLTRPAAAQLTILAVLLAIALAGFAAIVRGSIDTALSEAAWQQVGADYRLDRPIPIGQAQPPALDLAGVAGIEATARGEFFPNASLAPAVVRLGDVALLAIDPAAYATVVADTPADPGPALATLAAPAGGKPGTRENPLPAVISGPLGLGGGAAPWRYLRARSQRPGGQLRRARIAPHLPRH